MLTTRVGTSRCRVRAEADVLTYSGKFELLIPPREREDPCSAKVIAGPRLGAIPRRTACLVLVGFVIPLPTPSRKLALARRFIGPAASRANSGCEIRRTHVRPGHTSTSTGERRIMRRYRFAAICILPMSTLAGLLAGGWWCWLGVAVYLA